MKITATDIMGHKREARCKHVRYTAQGIFTDSILWSVPGEGVVIVDIEDEK